MIERLLRSLLDEIEMVPSLLDGTALQLFFQLLPDLFSDMFPDRVLPNELLLRCFDKFRW